jgi:hypothetical protein
MMSATRFRSKPAIDSDRCRPGGERRSDRLSFGISVSAMVGAPMMLCQRSIFGDRAEAGFSVIGGVTVRVARDGTAGRVTQKLWGTQALFDHPPLHMAWQVLLRWAFLFRPIRSKGSNMNAAGHPTRYRPEYREPADDCCPRFSLELAEFSGMVPRAVDNSIASLGGGAPDNTTCGVFALLPTFIPVRKNYLTRRAGAWRLTPKRKVVS